MKLPDFPRLVLSDGATESLKWLALLFMTGDHVNKYLLNGTQEWLYNFGRVAMPLFVGTFAYNLARPRSMVRTVCERTVKRLLVAGFVATPAFMALGGLVAGWWPLNMMFTLAAIALLVPLLERRDAIGYAAASTVLLLAGAAVEFCWPALAFGIAVWFYSRQSSWIAAALMILSLLSLWTVNGNLWAFGAVPVFVVVARVNPRVPRLRWFFYLYYPAHLSGLWLIRIPMRQAGYLFF